VTDEPQGEIRYHGDIRFSLSPSGEVTERDLLQNVLGAMGIPIVVINKQGQLAMWNNAFAERGNRTALVVGSALDRVIPDLAEPIRDRDWLATTREVCAAGGSVLERRVPLRLGEALPHLYDLGVHALHGPDGEVIGAVLVIEDVSDEVRQENLRLRSARTRSLANLGAAVAHEIRNPLNSIGLNLQRLQERIGERQTEGLEADLQILQLVEQEVQRLERIVSDFLDFSAPPRLQTRALDLRELIIRCLAVLDEEARNRGVELSHRFRELDQVPGDRDRLTQVFQNLLRNAIQAASQPPLREGRRPRVRVDGYQTSEAVAIAIHDTGPGVPPAGEDRQKLFDIFYTTRDGGTGLGLAIANRIVEDHGGYITCDNRHEGGATFTVFLPRKIELSEDLRPDDQRWQ
jgi:signal transduction histidine kinase